MKVDINKKYRTKDKCEVIIYAVYEDKDIVHGVVLDDFYYEPKFVRWDLTGNPKELAQSFGLKEVLPYEDFKIDDKVIVWDGNSAERTRRYFAGVNKNGKPLTFINGSTSWSSEASSSSWDNCIKAEE